MIEEMQNNNQEFIKDKVLNSKLSWRKTFVREKLSNVKDEVTVPSRIDARIRATE